MAIFSGENRSVLTSDRQADAASISKTFWGFIVRDSESARRRAEAGEVMAVFACLMFGTFAYAPWLLPVSAEGLLAGLTLPLKVGATSLFFGFSFFNYNISRRGLALETHIETDKGTLSMVRKNRAGAMKTVWKAPFAQVESIYLKRSKAAMCDSQLFVRLTHHGRPLPILRGRARDLEPILQGMVAQMRPGTAKPAAPAPPGVGPVAGPAPVARSRPAVKPVRPAALRKTPEAISALQ